MSMSRPSPPPPPHPPPSMAPPPMAPPRPLDLEITIISGKHLKNVNWRNGDLNPYAIFWVDPDNKLTTKSDDSGSTKPVWNQRFVLPITRPLHESSLSLEIFHSKASETPKPFVGFVNVNLSDLPEPDHPSKIRTFDVLRPSGRPQGKIRLKLAIKFQPLPPPPASDYQNAPHSSNYYSFAPPHHPYPSRSASSAGPTTGYPYHVGYYSGYYPPLPNPSTRPFSDRYGAPSAPVEYTQYEQKPRGGLGTGLAVGAVAGALGGIALDEGLKYEEEKIGDRVEDNLAARDDFSEYRVDY